MSLLTLCQWIQGTRLSALLGESTWGFPIVGALHVLAIALFGGVALAGNLHRDVRLRSLARAGLALVLVSGALLFWSQPVRCYQSWAFWVKLGLLLAIGVSRSGVVQLTLWAAVIFASRGIAYF